MKNLYKILITIFIVIIALLPFVKNSAAQTSNELLLDSEEVYSNEIENNPETQNNSVAEEKQENGEDEVINEKIKLYLFHSNSCPHCKAEIEYLNKLIQSRDDIELHLYEVSEIPAQNLVQNVGNYLEIDIRGVPITVVGNTSFVGFAGEEATDPYLNQIFDLYIQTGDPDTVGMLIENGGEKKVFTEDELNSIAENSTINKNHGNLDPNQDPAQNLNKDPNEAVPSSGLMLEIPFVGLVNISDFSLPIMTILLGLLDGFNPCAMWALLFLITLLLGMENHRKMWLLGVVFILVSGAVYFLFMAAWLNLFLYLGFIKWIRILVGVLAISAGVYHLYDLYLHSERGCKVSEGKRHKKYFSKFKEFAYKQNILVAIGGIAFLAVAVNMVEMVCSAGLPALYTQILALSDLTHAQYYGYITLYIVFFMLDDLIIFIIAMLTLKVVGIETKYGKYAKLIGGVLMIIIGYLLLFNPALLTFA